MFYFEYWRTVFSQSNVFSFVVSFQFLRRVVYSLLQHCCPRNVYQVQLLQALVIIFAASTALSF